MWEKVNSTTVIASSKEEKCEKSSEFTWANFSRMQKPILFMNSKIINGTDLWIASDEKIL